MLIQFYRGGDIEGLEMFAGLSVVRIYWALVVVRFFILLKKTATTKWNEMNDVDVVCRSLDRFLNRLVFLSLSLNLFLTANE